MKKGPNHTRIIRLRSSAAPEAGRATGYEAMKIQGSTGSTGINRLSRHLAIALGCAVLLSGCSDLNVEDDYLVKDPSRAGEYVYESELEKRGPQTVFGNEGLDLFDLGGSKKGGGGGGIGVNSYLWRASLDTIAFMPLASADPFGGVIITDWYVPPEAPRERYKMSVYILGRQLRADGIRVAVFRQQIRQPIGE